MPTPTERQDSELEIILAKSLNYCNKNLYNILLSLGKILYEYTSIARMFWNMQKLFKNV